MTAHLVIQSANYSREEGMLTGTAQTHLSGNSHKPVHKGLSLIFCFIAGKGQATQCMLPAVSDDGTCTLNTCRIICKTPSGSSPGCEAKAVVHQLLRQGLFQLTPVTANSTSRGRNTPCASLQTQNSIQSGESPPTQRSGPCFR